MSAALLSLYSGECHSFSQSPPSPPLLTALLARFGVRCLWVWSAHLLPSPPSPPLSAVLPCPVRCATPGGFFFGVRCPGLVCDRLFLPCPLTWQVPVFLALLFCSPSPGRILAVPHPTRVPITTPISSPRSEFRPLCVHSIVYLLHCFHISLTVLRSVNVTTYDTVHASKVFT